MAGKTFVYFPKGYDEKIEDLAEKLSKLGEYGLKKRDGTTNVSAVIQEAVDIATYFANSEDFVPRKDREQ